MWSSENRLIIHFKNKNGNDFKPGRTIQSKTINFWKKVNIYIYIYIYWN